MNRVIAIQLLLLISVLCGCASSTSSLERSTRSDVTVERTRSVDFIALPDRSPAAVVWDDAQQRLLIVDNVDNRVWAWTDKQGLSETPFGSCPLPDGESELPGNVTLGQAALLDDGTLAITRFGQPGAGWGGIAFMRPDGQTGLVPNLDPTAKRLGLALAPDAVLYGTLFRGGMAGASGAVTTVDLEQGEHVVAEGFGKLIGIVIANDRVYVSDQSSESILDAPLDALPEQAADWHVLAKLAKPDQLSTGPNGSLFSGQFQAAADSSDPIAVRQIAADGKVSAFRQDPDVSKPSGVAYDAKHERVFVADSGDASHIGVHVFEVQ